MVFVFVNRFSMPFVLKGRLLRRQLFGDIEDDADVSCSWTFFSNCLSEFFMRATRQDLLDSELLVCFFACLFVVFSFDLNLYHCKDLEKASVLPQPQRSLRGSDLEYLHAKGFSKSEHISFKEFQLFWEWFGPLAHQYRHNQVIRNLYLRGLIYGFISKDDCVNLLHKQQQGTFLIRSSESSTIGEFTLAFVNARLAVKHHKIDHKKLKPPFGNMADFLREKDQLSMVVKPFQANSQKLLVVPKNDVFAEFYTQKFENKDLGSYSSYLF